MIKNITEEVYQLEIPLPHSPLKSVNSYLVRSRDRSLLIDVGMNHEACLRSIATDLKSLAVDLRKTDFFITHFHSDHVGLLASLATGSSKIFFNHQDMDMLTRQPPINFACLNGFPEKELQKAIHGHPGYKYRSKKILKGDDIKEGDKICVGSYVLECIETPGHSPGHVCLYEPERKILFSGDHILKNITSNILLWSDDENPLGNYLKSLEKVAKLEIEMVLPGHGEGFKGYKERIRELGNHHQKRLREILSILSKQPMTAFETASRMTWDVSLDSWDVFPPLQKYFATGEVIAHLRYLEQAGEVVKDSRHQTRVYRLSGGRRHQLL